MAWILRLRMFWPIGRLGRPQLPCSEGLESVKALPLECLFLTHGQLASANLGRHNWASYKRLQDSLAGIKRAGTAMQMWRPEMRGPTKDIVKEIRDFRIALVSGKPMKRKWLSAQKSPERIESMKRQMRADIAGKISLARKKPL